MVFSVRSSPYEGQQDSKPEGSQSPGTGQMSSFATISTGCCILSFDFEVIAARCSSGHSDRAAVRPTIAKAKRVGTRGSGAEVATDLPDVTAELRSRQRPLHGNTAGHPAGRRHFAISPDRKDELAPCRDSR